MLIGAAGAVDPGAFGCARRQTAVGHNSEITEREMCGARPASEGDRSLRRSVLLWGKAKCRRIAT
jgi:hypothetical protein